MNIPLVSIKCLVYNQAPYLRQCLDGFVMQKTTFQFEAIVHDDASSDDSAVIIREYADKYPDIIKPLFEIENQYTKVGFAGLDNLIDVHLKGKYIALCEGDDYWTDPYKLQKQVDYLENHPECGLVHTKHKKYIEETDTFESGWAEETCFDKNLERNRICTLTTCFRKSLYDRYINEHFPRDTWPMGDAPLWLYIMSLSSSKLLNDETGVYRVLKESASHSESLEKNLSFLYGGYKMKNFFIKKYRKEEFQKINDLYVVNELKRLSYLYDEDIDFDINCFFLKNRIWNIRSYLTTLPIKSRTLRRIAKIIKG